MSLTEQAHSFIKMHLSIGDVAVDATVGNGHDTLFLAQQVTPLGFIFGFDIQRQAIESTKNRLQKENLNNHIKLFQVSHVHMEQHIPSKFHRKINAIMFNLGYLPGSNKTIITQTKSTLIALNKSINLLSSGGIITITAYPGHPGGETETTQIKMWCSRLTPKQFSLFTIKSSEKAGAPKLFIIKKHLKGIRNKN